MLHARASGQRHREHVRLLPPVQAVAGHAAHGQQRQHHANAEVICHWQPSSQRVENVWNNFRQGRFLKHSHVLPQTNGATFLVLSYLCPGTSYMSGVSILVLQYKDINFSQVVEIFKVKTTSMTIETWCRPDRVFFTTTLRSQLRDKRQEEP